MGGSNCGAAEECGSTSQEVDLDFFLRTVKDY